MIHIHDRIDANARRVRGLLDLFGFPRIWFRRHLRDLKSSVACQFEAVPIAELLRQHIKDKTLFDGKGRSWFGARIACRGRERRAESGGAKARSTRGCERRFQKFATRMLTHLGLSLAYANRFWDPTLPLISSFRPKSPH